MVSNYISNQAQAHSSRMTNNGEINPIVVGRDPQTLPEGWEGEYLHMTIDLMYLFYFISLTKLDMTYFEYQFGRK